jgi:Tol biopolymer transport system component
VAVAPASGGAGRLVPGFPGAFGLVEAMRWTPDGRRIVFMGSRGPDHAVWSVAPDGTGLRRLAPLRSVGDAAVFSPGGRWMAYNDRRGTLVVASRAAPRSGCSPGCG